MSAGAKTSRQIVIDSLGSRGGTASDLALTDDPDEADVVLFIEPAGDELEANDALQQIVHSQVYTRHKGKIVVYSAKDLPRPLVPGLYPSISKYWSGVLGCHGAPYLTTPNPFLGQDVGWSGKTEQLASFCGVCRRIPLRLRLLDAARRIQWTDISIHDTSAEFLGLLRQKDLATHEELKALFVRKMLEARYALCPRGNGPSSFRIFEAMQIGRAPVVIADEWMPPPGPDWPSFMIQVKQRDVGRLAEILRVRENEWEMRGTLARQAWVRFYSPERIGETIVRQACEVVDSTQWHRLMRATLARTYVVLPRRISLWRRKWARRALAQVSALGTM